MFGSGVSPEEAGASLRRAGEQAVSAVGTAGGGPGGAGASGVTPSQGMFGSGAGPEQAGSAIRQSGEEATSQEQGWSGGAPQWERGVGVPHTHVGMPGSSAGGEAESKEVRRSATLQTAAVLKPWERPKPHAAWPCPHIRIMSP